MGREMQARAGLEREGVLCQLGVPFLVFCLWHAPVAAAV